MTPAVVFACASKDWFSSSDMLSIKWLTDYLNVSGETVNHHSNYEKNYILAEVSYSSERMNVVHETE